MSDVKKDATIKLIKLKDPIPYGKSSLSEINLRAPNAGSYRGISVARLGAMDSEPLLKLLPRIAVENVTEAQLEQLSSRDMVEIFKEVGGFLAGD